MTPWREAFVRQPASAASKPHPGPPNSKSGLALPFLNISQRINRQNIAAYTVRELHSTQSPVRSVPHVGKSLQNIPETGNAFGSRDPSLHPSLPTARHRHRRSDILSVAFREGAITLSSLAQAGSTTLPEGAGQPPEGTGHEYNEILCIARRADRHEWSPGGRRGQTRVRT